MRACYVLPSGFARDSRKVRSSRIHILKPQHVESIRHYLMRSTALAEELVTATRRYESETVSEG